MPEELLTTRESARRLGIATATLFSWLSQSNAGTFVLRGQPVTIDYMQGGAKGQGRIMIEAREIDRLKDLMRVHPRSIRERRPPTRQLEFPGIDVKLGRPDD